MPPAVSVAVFAYNESAVINQCLDALAACAREASLTVHVLMNGCTDDTEERVRAYKPVGFTLVPVVIRRGDKANAWNVYTHEVAPRDAVLHVFTDGDMIVAPGSIAGLLERFDAVPQANGCAGLPVSGRSRNAFRDKLLRGHEMAGNLYALRGTFLNRVRDRNIRLPFGIFGEDGLVTMLVKHDLDTRSPRNDERVTATKQGGFAFQQLSPWRLRDWRIYRNRKMRYAVRRQQAHMLYPLLFAQGTGAMPKHVVDLYRAHHDAMNRRWRGVDTYFDWVARRRILRDVAAHDEVREEERAHLYS
ncbi:glycosyltransferase [Falsiroseomonas sp. E2-1-a4]|uniref:glycosyltransferase n=1 Tax=Falsiroseomonas sp. E2-1-a4 TaxID=3239299 RepID=UPI003F379E9A